MKKTLCLILILFGFTGIFAQQKNVTQAEFDSIYNNGIAKLKVTQYRMTIKNESNSEWKSLLPIAQESIPSSFSSSPLSIQSAREDPFNSSNPYKPKRIGDPTYIGESTTIIEYASPSVYRHIFEAKSQTTNNGFSPNIINPGPSITRIERITIGNESYIKVGNEKWKAAKFPAIQSFQNQLTLLEEETKYQFLGKENLDGQSTSVYQKIEKRKSINSSNKTKTSLTSTMKYWFSEDGRLLKTEIKNKSQTGQSVFNSKSTTVYEADSSIKIEKPI